MNRDKLERLLWEEADGTLSAEDRVRLEQLMKGRGEAGNLRSEIAAVGRLLSSLPRAEPPGEMRESIQTALAARQRERARETRRSSRGPLGDLAGRLGGWFGTPWNLRLGYGLAGTVLGIVIALLVSAPRSQRGEGNDAYFYGSVPASPQRSAGLALADGRVRLSRDGSVLVAVLESHDARPLELSLEQATPGMRWLGASESSPAAQTVALEDGRRLSLTQDGPGSLEIRLALVEGALVEVRVVSAGQTLAARTMSLEEIPTR